MDRSKQEILTNEIIESYGEMKTAVCRKAVAHLLVDLFVMGDTPEQQTRANKSRELLIHLGIINYGNNGIPVFNDVKKITDSILKG